MNRLQRCSDGINRDLFYFEVLGVAKKHGVNIVRIQYCQNSVFVDLYPKINQTTKEVK